MSAEDPFDPAGMRTGTVLPPAATERPGARPRPPSIITRGALGVLVFVGIYFGLVTVVGFINNLTSQHGIPSPIGVSGMNLVYLGTALAVLGAASYISRPTRAYGPIALAADAVELIFLYMIYVSSPFQLSLSSIAGGGSNTPNIALSLGFAAIILVTVIATLLTVAADAVLTAEDFRYPGERVWWTYPIR